MKPQDLKIKKGMLLVEPILPKQKTASGIILGHISGLSELLREMHSVSGYVRTIGLGLPAEITVGAKIYYHRWGANAINLEDREYLLLDVRDVLAIEINLTQAQSSGEP